MSDPTHIARQLARHLVCRGLHLPDEAAATAWRALLMEIDRQSKSSKGADLNEALTVAMDTTDDPYGDGTLAQTRNRTEAERLVFAMLAGGDSLSAAAMQLLGLSKPTIRRALSRPKEGGRS